MILTAKSYNTKGEAICLYENKVFYVRGLIVGEVAKCEVIEEHEKWGKARIVEITDASPERQVPVHDNQSEIGGYELMHMSREEQTRFKIAKIEDDFKRNANFDISLEDMFIGKKLTRYRNKITLHDGAFHKRDSHEKIHLDDFLLTDIKPETSLSGEVIIRSLDTVITGNKGQKGVSTTDTLLGLKFRVDLNAFYQVNKEVAEAAYEEMLDYIPEGSKVFDLFSGIGTISLLAAKKAEKVIAVERNKWSHNDAVYNKQLNNIRNVEFIHEDVFRFVSKTNEKPDVVIVDPAREGLKRKTCEMLLEIKPKRIIYLSCNPGTQAADFNRLKDNYDIVFARPFDMFPNTYHIENLIVLDRK